MFLLPKSAFASFCCGRMSQFLGGSHVIGCFRRFIHVAI